MDKHIDRRDWQFGRIHLIWRPKGNYPLAERGIVTWKDQSFGRAIDIFVVGGLFTIWFYKKGR